MGFLFAASVAWYIVDPIKKSTTTDQHFTARKNSSSNKDLYKKYAAPMDRDFCVNNLPLFTSVRKRT